MDKLLIIFVSILFIISAGVSVGHIIYVFKQKKKYNLSTEKIVGFVLYSFSVFMMEVVFARLYIKVIDIATTFIIILCLILLVVPYLALNKMLREIIEKSSVDAEYEFLLRKSEADKKCYMLMKNYEERMSKLRHDFMNQIQVAHMVIEDSENREEGIKLLDALQEKINSTRINTFCSNKTVNIILSMKNKELKESAIDLETDIILGGKINIDEKDLCAIFINLLDEIISLADINKNKERLKCYLKCRKGEGQIVVSAGYPIKLSENGEESEKIIKNYDKYFSGIVGKYNGDVYYKNKNEKVITLEN